ncbi:MAG: flagellar export chaperone FliS [Candidatus Zixiibacteriota bacterium]|nr:MAG: flagellar export chaperone FliS [candidate division Zixibacteria bacterium]
MNNHLRTYQQMHISGLNQKELIVILYSGALRFIEEGRVLILKKDVPGTHEKLSKARNIFIHLLSTLDMETGGEFAIKLSSLYAYFIEKITMANATKNVEELDEIVPFIKDIKEAWEKIDINGEDIPDSKKMSRMEPVQVFSAEA